MKKIGFFMFLLLFVMLYASQNQVMASGSIPIILDGKTLEVPGKAQVVNVNGSVMVPFRVVGENLGFDVDWEQKAKKVTLKNQEKTIELFVNKNTATVDGSRVNLLTPPLMKNESVVVPIRFISEQMGLHVSFDGVNKEVYLQTQDKAAGNENQSGPKEGTKPVVEPSAPSNDSNSKGENKTGSTRQNEQQSGADNGGVTSGGGKLKGVSFSDNRLMIAIDGSAAVKPQVFAMSSPDRIVIDLPNTTYGDTFKQDQLPDVQSQGEMNVNDYPDVSRIRYSIFSNDPPTIRIVLDMNYAKEYSFYEEDQGSGLFVVDLNKIDGAPVQSGGGNGKKIVVIDAGHGDQDPGTTGTTGTKEKNFNLAVALKVGQLLQNDPDIDVVLTRSDDTFLELKDRVKIANDLNADVFVSIHANSATSSSASGSETYYQRDASKSLANVMHKYLVQASGLPDRKVKYGNFHVIRETKMPAVLLEVGYLSNAKDEAALFSESVQNSVAQGIVNGVKEYLGIH